MNAMAHVRGDVSGCAEYWRREADRLQSVVYDLKAQVAGLRAPITIMYRGVEDGKMVERSIVRIPEERWAEEVERFPQMVSWEWTASDGLMFLFGPPASTVINDVAPSVGPVARDD